MTNGRTCSSIRTGITHRPTDIFFAAVARVTNSNWLLSEYANNNKRYAILRTGRLVKKLDFRSVSAYLDSWKLGPGNAVVHVKLALIYRDQG